MPNSTEANPSRLKPLVTADMVLPVLQAYFGRPVLNLEGIQGGDVAQAFSFSVGPEDAAGAGETQDFIVLFNPPMSVNFEKEAYAYENFASPQIPISRVVHLGNLRDIDYAITEKLPGQNLLQIPQPDYLALIPRLIETLDAIHQIPIEGKPDYGFGNVLAQAGKLTAILDWMSARYGDYLYDIAWLDFWAPQDLWAERFQQYYHHAGRVVPFYNGRILCGQCFISLSAMKFYAKAGSREGYDFVKERINTRFQNE